MGEESKKQSGQADRSPDSKTAGTGTAAGNPRPAAAAAETGRTAGTGRTAEAPQPLAKALVIEEPQPPKPETPKGGKRDRKKKSAPKKAPQAYNAEQISALILAASGIIGSRPGKEIFTLQPEEAQQLATPIANMIAKSEKLANLGEYADAISLVSAALIIFVPRFLVYADQQKAVKAKAAGGVKLVRTDGEKQKNAASPDGGGKPDSGKHTESAAGIHSAIPGILG